MSLSELPIDIVVLIFNFLGARDFLSFTSCTRTLREYRADPTFWKELTQENFRIPSQPLVVADGARWRWLYKNLYTQTHVFTWGNNEKGNLGQGDPRQRLRRRREQPHELRKNGWPTEMADMDKVGVVADVQCGGWSTVILNSSGQLWAVGQCDGRMLQGPPTPILTLLKFPHWFGQQATTRKRYNADTAISQFSMGRSTLLGIADSGLVWEWKEFDKPAQNVDCASAKILEKRKNMTKGEALRVFAGWSVMSIYVTGSGIVFYNEPQRHWPAPQLPHEQHAFCIQGSENVPGTSYQRCLPRRFRQDSQPAMIGEVVTHVVLENHIVFTTHLNKLFYYRLSWAKTEVDRFPEELATFTASIRSPIQDLQGSFRKFGLFTKDGSVLLGTEDLLESYQFVPSPPFILPSLQNAGIISLAFGDYHFHALHANGTITSHGEEPRFCGAFGLGSHMYSRFRGVKYAANENGTIPAPSWSDGRKTVWFEYEKTRWLSDTVQKAAVQLRDSFERDSYLKICRGEGEIPLVVGEWFERGGREWHRGPKADGQDTDISPYFALKVTAAGWHSAALVLVDPAKAELSRQKWLQSATSALPYDRQAETANESAIEVNVMEAGTVESAAAEITTEENRLGDDAEGDEMLSPGEQLVQRVSWLLLWLYELGRWFLGLRVLEIAGQETEEEPPESLTQAPDDERYIWQNSAFPRLRYPGGEMPGPGPLTEWRGSEPSL